MQARHLLEGAGACRVAEEDVGELASLQRASVAPNLVLGLDVEAGLEVGVDVPRPPLGAVDPEHSPHDTVGFAVLHVEEPSVVGVVGRAAVVDVVPPGVGDPRPVLQEALVGRRGRGRVRLDPELLDRQRQCRRVLSTHLGPALGSVAAHQREGARPFGQHFVHGLVREGARAEPPVEDERRDLVVAAECLLGSRRGDEGSGDARVLGPRRRQAVANRHPVPKGALGLSRLGQSLPTLEGIGGVLVLEEDPGGQ